MDVSWTALSFVQQLLPKRQMTNQRLIFESFLNKNKKLTWIENICYQSYFLNFERWLVTFELWRRRIKFFRNPVICSNDTSIISFSSFIVSIFFSFCWYQTLVRKKNKTLILFPFQRQQYQISCGWKKNESPCIF
jgi:hypothetical protein